MNDPMETCPYDECHRIRRSGMAFHLSRCARNHPNIKKKTCPYDVRHILDPVDYYHHVNNCPAREGVIRQGNLAASFSDWPEDAALSECNEGWDDDPQDQIYNPLQRNIEDKPIVRILIGASKSEKKKFRDEERKRIQQIERQKEREEKERQAAAAAKALRKRTRAYAKDASARVFETDLNQENILRLPNKIPDGKSELKVTKITDTKLNKNDKEFIETISSDKANDLTRFYNGSPIFISDAEGRLPLSNLIHEPSQNILINNQYGKIDNLNKYELSQYNRNTTLNNIESFDITESENSENDSTDSIIDKVTKSIQKLMMIDEGFQKVTSKRSRAVNKQKKATPNN